MAQIIEKERDYFACLGVIIPDLIEVAQKIMEIEKAHQILLLVCLLAYL